MGASIFEEGCSPAAEIHKRRILELESEAVSSLFIKSGLSIDNWYGDITSANLNLPKINSNFHNFLAG